MHPHTCSSTWLRTSKPETGKRATRETKPAMDRFKAETDDFRTKTVHDLISLQGKVAVVTGTSGRQPQHILPFLFLGNRILKPKHCSRGRSRTGPCRCRGVRGAGRQGRSARYTRRAHGGSPGSQREQWDGVPVPPVSPAMAAPCSEQGG